MLKRSIIIMLCAGMLAGLGAPAAHADHYDHVALEGVKTGKALFDVNLSDAGKLVLYLKVIKETREGLLKQKVKPDMIVAFRGPSVLLVSKEQREAGKDLTEAWQLITALKKNGVRFEACAVATRLFAVENSNILPEIEVVGNTFISLIGYQSKGYALIPIM